MTVESTEVNLFTFVYLLALFCNCRFLMLNITQFGPGKVDGDSIISC